MYSYQAFKKSARSRFVQVATSLNRLSRGRLKPNHLTIFGLLLHLPVALLLVEAQLLWAAAILVFACLLDALDGALARSQKTTSTFGGWLDASSDRLGEIILFMGLTAYLQQAAESQLVLTLAVGVLGCSLLISYLKAKGEALLANGSQKEISDLNERFSGGLLNYEQRVLLTILMIISQWWLAGLLILFVGSLITILMRSYKVYKTLKE